MSGWDGFSGAEAIRYGFMIYDNGSKQDRSYIGHKMQADASSFETVQVFMDRYKYQGIKKNFR